MFIFQNYKISFQKTNGPYYKVKHLYRQDSIKLKIQLFQGTCKLLIIRKKEGFMRFSSDQLSNIMKYPPIPADTEKPD